MAMEEEKSVEIGGSGSSIAYVRSSKSEKAGARRMNNK